MEDVAPVQLISLQKWTTQPFGRQKQLSFPSDLSALISHCVSTNRKGDKKHMMWQNVLPSSFLQASIQKERLWKNNFYSASTSTQLLVTLCLISPSTCRILKPSFIPYSCHLFGYSPAFPEQ